MSISSAYKSILWILCVYKIGDYDYEHESHIRILPEQQPERPHRLQQQQLFRPNCFAFTGKFVIVVIVGRIHHRSLTLGNNKLQLQRGRYNVKAKLFA